MNKSEIIKEVAKRTGVPISEAKKIVEATLDIISEHVKLGEDVKLSGFGTFGTQRKVEVASTRQKGKHHATVKQGGSRDRNATVEQSGIRGRHATLKQSSSRDHGTRKMGKSKAVFSPGSRFEGISVGASEKTGDPGEFITKGKK